MSVKSVRNYESMVEESNEVILKMQKFFKEQGYKIIDRREDVTARKLGIDFEIYDTKRWMFRINVVADSKIHDTGNLFIEHKMERSTKTSKGWLHYCLADKICYYDSVQDILYILDWKKLREVVSGYPLVHFKNEVDIACTGYGYLISIQEAKAKGYITMTVSLANNTILD